jgi:hypothetical protein
MPMAELRTTASGKLAPLLERLIQPVGERMRCLPTEPIEPLSLCLRGDLHPSSSTEEQPYHSQISAFVARRTDRARLHEVRLPESNLLQLLLFHTHTLNPAARAPLAVD